MIKTDLQYPNLLAYIMMYGMAYISFIKIIWFLGLSDFWAFINQIFVSGWSKVCVVVVAVTGDLVIGRGVGTGV